LYFYIDNIRLQLAAREIVAPLGQLGLGMPSLVCLQQELEKAKGFQEEGASVAPLHRVCDCVQAVMLNARWTVMDDDEQGHFQPAVTAFAVWCMSNFSLVALHNVHVGMKGVMVVYHMAAGSMQVDD